MAFLTETTISRQFSKPVSKRLMIAVRIRPLQAEETGRSVHSMNDGVVVLEDNEADKNDVLRANRSGERQYVFDAVFGEDVTQEKIFEKTTKGLVKDVLEGYNATIFAYGASGSGKTHTMLGNNSEPGIMVRALNEIFNVIKNTGLHQQYNAVVRETVSDENSGAVVRFSGETVLDGRRAVGHPNQKQISVSHTAQAKPLKAAFVSVHLLPPEGNKVTMSYLEIYNENIRDLLNPSSGCLGLREDQKEKTIQVVNLSEVSTNSTEEMMRLLQKGNRARTMEPTALNKTSSRSHALLSITVRQTLPLESGQSLSVRVKQGKLFMIDLAGSERASQTKNQGKRLVEGAHINRSLLALGNCINALSGGATYVNYRDSKLTRLLKDALSGNSQTCMIAHVSPAAVHREESKNTLVYADRAKNITNKVEKNVLDISHQVTQYRTIISELRDEIARLKQKIPKDRKSSREHRQRRGETENGETAEPSPSKENPLNGLKNEIISTFREQMKLRKRLLNIESYLLELDLEADRQHTIIYGYEGKSRRVYKTEVYSGRMPEQPDVGSLDLDYQEIDRDPRKSLEKAMIELALIEKEQEKYTEMKTITETELEKCKEKACLLERELPYEVNTEEERELLCLLIRVYELEIEKIVFQSERLTREYVLRQRDLTIEKYNKQKRICEEIISRQREVIEEENLSLPPDLLQLYQLYQQEIHSPSCADHNLNEIGPSPGSGKLPPIRTKRTDYPGQRDSSDTAPYDSDNSTKTPSSSAGSDWPLSPLPPITARRHSSFSTGTAFPSTAAVLFPPISKSHREHR